MFDVYQDRRRKFTSSSLGRAREVAVFMANANCSECVIKGWLTEEVVSPDGKITRR